MQGIRKDQVPASNCLHQLCKSAYVDCDLSLVRVIVRFVQQGYGGSFDNVVRKSAVYFMINVFHYPMMADGRKQVASPAFTHTDFQQRQSATPNYSGIIRDL